MHDNNIEYLMDCPNCKEGKVEFYFGFEHIYIENNYIKFEQEEGYCDTCEKEFNGKLEVENGGKVKLKLLGEKNN